MWERRGTLLKILFLFALLHVVSSYILKSKHKNDIQEKEDVARILQILRNEKLKQLADEHIEHKTKKTAEKEEPGLNSVKNDVEEEEEEKTLSLFEPSGFRRSQGNKKVDELREMEKEVENLEDEEEEIEDEEVESLRSIDKKSSDDAEKEVMPDEDPQLFSLLNSFVDEHNGVIVEGGGVNKLYKAEKNKLDTHKYTHLQKVQMGMESELPGETKKRNFVTQTSTFWPQGIVPYEITNDFSSSQRSIIEGAIAEVAAKTCVRFIPRQNTDPNSLGHNSYIEFFSESGCWSYVGRVFSGRQQISLQAPGCVTNSITIHEMCHAIGMMHEQSRSDRDNYVTMLWNNIQGGTGNNNMHKESTLDNNRYDHESVLQYSLYAFSTNGQPTMEFHDRRLDFLANSALGLTFYDVKDITTAYDCTTMNNCAPKVCENGGFQDHTCNCYCPDGLTGDNCQFVDSSPNCGGIIDVSNGPQTITTPNYPSNYNTGVKCVWLVKGAAGQFIEVTMDDLHLSDNGVSQCYHWLEVQFNLLGQTGPKRCGDVIGESYLSTPDGFSNMMLLQFDSVTEANQPSSKGFSLTVRQTGPGCINQPCVMGTCSVPNNADFLCTCDPGFSGTLCDIPSPSALFSCTFDDNKCFMTDATDDIFDWTGHSGSTPSSGTGPSAAHSGSNYLYAEMSSPRVQGDIARYVSRFNFPDLARCLRFWYFMYGGSVGTLSVAVEGSTTSKQTLWSLSGDQGQAWFEASVDVASMSGLKIFFEAVRGSSWNGDIAIDDITLVPGSCSSTTQAPTTQAPTTQAPTTQAPTTQAPTTQAPTTQAPSTTTANDPCNPNPCLNGGICIHQAFNGACLCLNGFAGPTCATPESVYYNCTFDSNTACFLVDDTNDDFDWTLRSGGTPSSSTGPSNAYSLPNYLYTEASSPRDLGDKAILKTNALYFESDRCLTFRYHMFGSNMGNLSVTTETGGVVWTRSGNQGDQWRLAQIDIPSSLNLMLTIEASVGNGYRSDIAIDDATLELGNCVIVPSTQAPSTTTETSTLPTTSNPQVISTTTAPPGTTFTCSLEPGAPCFLYQEVLFDSFDWTVTQSATPSSNTGPSAANEGSYYAFIEASSPRVHGDVAVVSSHILPAEDFCLVFDYHMYGANMGELNVLVSSVPIVYHPGLFTSVWSKFGDQGDVWKTAAVHISAIPNLRILFEAIRGSSYTSDIAIDNIIMTPGSCGCQSSPCLNGGTCSEDGSGLTMCACPPEYTGATCEALTGGVAVDCTFEAGSTCFLQQGSNDDFDWTIRTGTTPTSSTGPSVAYEGDKYAYIETSSPRQHMDTAELYASLTQSVDDRCLSFAYHMYGADIGTLEVLVGTSLTSVWSQSGELGDTWNIGAVDIDGTVSGEIIIKATRGLSYRGDIAIDDLVLRPGKCGCVGNPCANGGTCNADVSSPIGYTCTCPAGYTGPVCESPDGTAPLTCSFEVGESCFLSQVDSGLDVFDWSIRQGSTPSSSTGPSGAFSGLKYAYIEASSPRVEGDNAIMSTESFILPPSERCLKFNFHMYGQNVGKLIVLAGERGQESVLWKRKNDKGDLWKTANINIPAYTDGVIAIEGVRGAGWQGDIAIDGIELSQGSCP